MSETRTNDNELYSILNIDRGSSQSEIKSAYRKLAVRWHPDKNISSETSKEEAEKRFKEIANAFSILSDENLRRKYDEGGMDALNNNNNNHNKKSGAGGERHAEDASSGNGCGGATSSYNSKEIFDSFFAHENPFVDLGFDASTDFRSRRKAKDEKKKEGGDQEKERQQQQRQQQQQQQKQQEAKEEIHDLPCTLEDLNIGAEKVVKVTRNRFSDEGQKTLEESKILRIKLHADTCEGTGFRFPGDGDEWKDSNGKVQAGDLIFRIREIPHAKFQRDGRCDLIYTARITLVQALTYCKIKVPTLGGKTLFIPCPEVIHTNYKRILTGEGMIDPNKPSKRGNLIIRFEIEFPQTPLKEEIKQELCRLLK